jgi:hypothetical protein
MGMAEVNPHAMVQSLFVIFILAALGAALVGPFSGEINSWAANLTEQNQTAAAAVILLIPLIYWILLGVGVILYTLGVFLGHEH